MNHPHLPSPLRSSLLAACLLLAGCFSPPEQTRYFTLSLPEQPPVVEARAIKQTIGLRPVVLAGYLDRSHLAIREAGHEIRYAEGQRWGEPLQRSLDQSLADALRRHLPLCHLQSQPWREPQKQDWRLGVEIRRFEGERLADGTAQGVLEAQWSLERIGGTGVVLQKFERVRVDWDGNDPLQLVGNLAQALDTLAQRIAAGVPE